MNAEAYQLITLGEIFAIGLICGEYLDYSRRKLINNFCDEKAPRLIEKARKIDRDLTKRFKKLNKGLEKI